MGFINEVQINALLEDESLDNKELQRDIIKKAREAKGLSLKDCAALLRISDKEILEEMFHTAKEVKEQIYGKRLVMFAPLYVTNQCVNNCLYCAFRKDNKELTRKTLAIEEIREEAEYLVKQGHKRVLLVAGEHPKMSSLDFIGKSVEAIYDVNIKGNNIRRININTAPMSVEDFKVLKSFEVGTYQCFQETYHYDTYTTMHPSGPKRDYSFRLTAMDRAVEAGIDDVGIGALFGLTDYRFEMMAMLQHAFYLDEKFGVGPHTISVPRLEPANNAPVAEKPPFAVDDDQFRKLISILRLAVPYTGIILSTRERADLRRELYELGVSQISAGSRTSPGSYHESKESLKEHQMEQFQLGDHRSLEQVVADCCDLGYVPSFCTACYRTDRTGDRFMALAKTGNIGKLCTPNALATFKEYANDFAGEETAQKAKDLIEKELKSEEESIVNKTRKMIDRVDDGERDVFF